MTNKWMNLAIEIAKNAYEVGDLPVGAVIVWKNNGEKLLSKSANFFDKNTGQDFHAEIIAINQTVKLEENCRGGFRKLSECDIYVTLEPCLMCAGAILNARIQNIYFGAFDPENGAFSRYEIEKKGVKFPKIYGGIMENECSELLKMFFRNKR